VFSAGKRTTASRGQIKILKRPKITSCFADLFNQNMEGIGQLVNEIQHELDQKLRELSAITREAESILAYNVRINNRMNDQELSTKNVKNQNKIV
jgi:hypothetical protein